MTSKICLLHSQGDLRVAEISAPDVVPGSVVVAVARGGICGSDLHYYQNGGIGSIKVQEPIILGHEISGTIKHLGDETTDLKVGDKVAINPSQPCFSCHHCKRNEHQHCLHMRFLGSARTMPHVQGGFQSDLVIPASQCVKVRSETSLASAACAEPLAVCLHAAVQAGDLGGKRVLITGAGPIGALCAAVSKSQGAEVVVVTDLTDFTLEVAQQMGASKCINVATAASEMEKFRSPSDQFDVVFECSAAESAIHMAIDYIRPRGTIVQVGVAGNLNLPINAIVGKEIILKGTSRFHSEFLEAVTLIDQGKIEVEPMISSVFPVHQAVQAFAAALDHSSAVKVQLTFDDVLSDS